MPPVAASPTPTPMRPIRAPPSSAASGVTTSPTTPPARSISKSSARPGASRTRRTRSAQAATAVPEIASTRSPTCSPARAQQAPAQVLPARHRPAVDRGDEIAVADAGRRRRAARRRCGNDRPLPRHAGDVGPGEQQHGKQQVGDRTGYDNGDPPPDTLPVERPRQVGGCHVAFALVGHLHVAAERNRRDRPFGAVGTVPPRPEHAGRIRTRSAAP
jgi:hypothetical protein